MLNSRRIFDRGDSVLVIDMTEGVRLVVHVSKTNGVTPDKSTIEKYLQSAAKRKGVSFIKKVKNLTVAGAKHVAAGRPKATQAQIDERFTVCEQCEYLLVSKMECCKCGCGIKSVKGPLSKLAWADSKCPAKKW